MITAGRKGPKLRVPPRSSSGSWFRLVVDGCPVVTKPRPSLRSELPQVVLNDLAGWRLPHSSCCLMNDFPAGR
jgi:hypothetical protein